MAKRLAGKQPAKKRPVGRPEEYKPEYCDVVIEQMKEGASKTEVAAILGTYRDRLIKWAAKHPDFANAIKKGEELSKAWWLKQGRVALREQAFNATLYYMNMKNRHGWADKSENKVNVTATPEIIVKFVKGSDANNKSS